MYIVTIATKAGSIVWSNFNGTSANGTILVNGKDVDVTMSANYSFSSTNESNFFLSFHFAHEMNQFFLK